MDAYVQTSGEESAHQTPTKKSCPLPDTVPQPSLPGMRFLSLKTKVKRQLF
jgi:hypothetical protein